MQAADVERSIITSVPHERVWKTVTNPKALSKWHTPLSGSFDKLVVGEIMTFVHEGTTEAGAITAVEPHTRFAYRWKPHTDYDIQTLVTYTFETLPEGTRVTVTEEGFEALPATARQTQIGKHSRGWGLVLDRMKAYVEAFSE